MPERVSRQTRIIADRYRDVARLRARAPREPAHKRSRDARHSRARQIDRLALHALHRNPAYITSILKLQQIIRVYHVNTDFPSFLFYEFVNINFTLEI